MSTRPKNGINRIITAQVNQKLRETELKHLKKFINLLLIHAQNDPRP